MKQTRLTRNYQLALGLVLLGTLYLSWQSNPGRLLQYLTGVTYDLLVVSEQPENDSRVVIVDVDDQSLKQIGRWPWPRETLASLIEQIQRQQPAVIGLDFLLPEAGEGDPTLKLQLAAANVVTPITYGLSTESSDRPKVVSRIGLSPSLFTREQTTLAHITPNYDPDGSIRQLYPVICQRSCTHTLALQMLETLIGMGAQASTTYGIVPGAKICAGPYCLQQDEKGAIWVPYQHWKNFRHIPAADLLNGKDYPALRGSMVLLGTSAVGLGDNVTTPLSPDTPGVRIHANLLTSWFDSISWRPLPHQSGWLTAILIAWGLLAMRWPGGQLAWRITILTTGIAILTLPWLLSQQGYWINPLPLGWMVAAGLLCMAAHLGIHSLQQRRWLYKAFGQYVPSEVLKQLVKSRTENRAMSAQRANITVLFADIQGFTPLSERLSPDELAEMTNHLFTELTDEIHRHQGTLDKFMGDAVMAFWGAPLPQPDHASLALNCALKLEERVKTLTPWLEARNLPEIRLSIALETGEVTVGNLGSRQRRAYTVLGSSVNLAAHLQSMHKELGDNLLIGPNLCKTLPHRVQALGEFEIRGISGLQKVGTALNEERMR